METTMPYWNGEKCEARRVLIRVGEPPIKTWWFAHLTGKEMRAVEIKYGLGAPFYIADEDGNGWHKVTAERGGPHCGHKSVVAAEVIRERAAEELDDRDCDCAG